jgi:hypothetical protein
LFWLPAFLLFFYSSSSFSAQCPAGYPSTIDPGGSYIVAGQSSYKYPSPEIGCSNAASIDKFWGNGYTGSGSGVGSSACTVTKTSDNTTFQTSIAFSSGNCPPDYALVNGVCTCDASCPAAGSFFGAGEVSGSGSSGCSNNCAITSGGSCIASNDPITGTVSSNWCSNWTYTGGSCTGDDATQSESPEGVPSENGGRPTKPSDCPPQTGYAEINGVASCLPSGSTYGSGSSTSTDSSTGNTTQVNTTTTINSDGSRTTTTITNVYDSGGGLLSTNTTTQTDGQIGDGKGKEDSSFGDAPSFDDTLPGEAVFDIQTQTGQTLSTDIFSVSASCPAPIVFEALGQEFSIGFQPVCDLAHIIRGIILMLAAIAAIRIIVQGG